jgi:hypothetical protein
MAAEASDGKQQAAPAKAHAATHTHILPIALFKSMLP